MTAPAQTITLVGAGLMGHGIAHVLARAGHHVRVYDLSQAALDSLPARLGAIDALLAPYAEGGGTITAHSDLAEAADGASFVIEAAAENLHIKRQIIAELEPLIAPDAIITSNTSAIPITQIAAEAQHPERIVGTHFWNPPHLVKLVEVTQAERSSPETVQAVIALLSDAGHRAVHVKKDIPGFIGNRLQHALKREAIALVANGVCDAQTVDDVVKSGFGSRMAVLGPLEQTDLVGVDLTEAIHETLMPDLDTTGAPHPYVSALVAKGHTGMASGKGFYDWTEESTQALKDRLNAYLAAAAKRQER